MTDRPNKPRFPNPFYATVLVVGALFVVTCLAYLVVPSVLAQAEEPGRDTDGSAGVALLLSLFNERAPLILAVECGILIVAGLLAMATDRWFSPPKARRDTPEP